MPEVTAAPVQAPEKRTVRRSIRPGGRKKKLRTLVALSVAAALLSGGGFALHRFLNSGGEEQGEIWAQEAEIGTIQSTVSGSGTARSKESAAITLTASGTVQEVYVTGGQTVMAGDPLYTIYSQAAQEKLDAATEKLNDLLEEAANLTVQAPFAGKLQNVTAFEPDQEVARGTKVAELVNDRQLKLELYFNYAYEDDVYPGQTVEVSIPAVMRTFQGWVEKVNRVSFISKEGAVHFQAVIVFDNPGTLTAGMDASAVLHAGGVELYPYENGQTQFYEVRTVTAKASGPVVGMGNLLNYANVAAGEPLLYLGSDTIDGKIKAAREELDTATKEYEKFNAVAPIDGTVTSCAITQGQEVKSGDTVVMISNNVSMLVTIQVDDRNISFIKPGSYVNLDWNGNQYQGLVTSIDMGGAQSGQGMTNYPVTLSVDNFDGSLMDGAWLQYSFVTSESSGCVTVPVSAVQRFNDLEGNPREVVFVRREERPGDVPELDLPAVEPGTKRTFPGEEEGYYPVIVETGLSDVQNVEILSGVEAGDTVFVHYTVTQGSWG